MLLIKINFLMKYLWFLMKKKPSFEIGRFNTVSDRDFHFASYGDLPNNVLNDLYESCDK